MPGSFLYFLPGADKRVVDCQRLRDAGLGDALRDCLTTDAQLQRSCILHQVLSGGPDPKTSGGVMIIPIPAVGPGIGGPGEQSAGYYKDRQTWEDCGGYWLGTDNEFTPTPESLQRPKLISGIDCELQPGSIWHCPLVRCPLNQATNLRQSLGKRNGRGVSFVVPDSQWAWDLAGKVWDQVRGVLTDGVTFLELFESAVKFLSINYRVGEAEATRIGIFDTENVLQPINAAIDWPIVEAFLAQQRDAQIGTDELKKNSPPPDLVNMSPGNPDSSPDTAPLEAKSTS